LPSSIRTSWSGNWAPTPSCVATSAGRDGIRRMKALDADVVLIDAQFALKVIVKPDVEGMIDLIAAAATQEHVGLFHRFALMRHWHEVDGMPFATFVSADGVHMND
jgi:hypothetical protein